VKLSNITATCCGAQLHAEGLAVECPKCHTVFQIRDRGGNFVLAVTPHKMRPMQRWYRRVIARLPIVGRWFRGPSTHVSIQGITQ